MFSKTRNFLMVVIGLVLLFGVSIAIAQDDTATQAVTPVATEAVSVVDTPAPPPAPVSTPAPGELSDRALLTSILSGGAALVMLVVIMVFLGFVMRLLQISVPKELADHRDMALTNWHSYLDRQAEQAKTTETLTDDLMISITKMVSELVEQQLREAGLLAAPGGVLPGAELTPIPGQPGSLNTAGLAFGGDYVRRVMGGEPGSLGDAPHPG